MSARQELNLAVDEAGLCLRGLGLWLDPVRPVPAAFVSHAHAVSAAASARVLASRETLALIGALGGVTSGARALGWDETVEWPVAGESGGGAARLRIAPAGHMLGAAQLIVEYAEATLVYTGDFSPEEDATHPAGTAIACDELVLTSTFALPIFRFPPQKVTLGSIADWCAARLSSGTVPIVLAQNPGPAQSVARELVARGMPVAAPDDVRRTAAIYESLGVAIGPLVPCEPGVRDVAIVASAGEKAAHLTDMRGRGRKGVEVAYASGWALLDAAVEQRRADVAFALADHADHDALLALTRACGTDDLHVSRGDARVFARLLRGGGANAEAIELPPIDERGTS
jgi:putative mRNA 3-end processing factor